MTRNRSAGLVLGLALGFLAGCSLTLAAPPPAGEIPFRTQPWPTPTPSLPPVGLSLQTGRSLFQEHCASCHGLRGRGDGPQAAALRARTPDARLDLTESLARRAASLRDWFQVVTRGRVERGMPPWSTTLSDSERWAVVLYAWSLAVPPELMAEAESRYREACAACHGEDGRKGPVPLADPERMLERVPSAWVEALQPGRIPAHAGLPELSTDLQQALIAYLPQLAFSIADGGALQLPRPVAIGSVSGQVLHGTTEAPASGVTVTLYVLLESSPVFSRTVSTRADGTFRFDAVPVYPEAAYLPVAEWQEVAYPAPHPLTLTVGQEVTVTLMVFDRGTDPGGIHIDQVHWILQPLADRLFVTEVWVFSNRGTTTYGGAGSPGMIFFLPPGASNLRISEGTLGGRYRQEEDRLIDTAPIPPGAGYQTAFGYELPLARARTLPLRSAYPVDRWNLLIAGGALQASGAGLRDLGMRTLGNTTYHLYEVDPPAPGQTRTVALRPRAPVPPWLIPLLLALSAGAVLGFFRLWRGREVDLIDEIARLDEAYAAGEVDEATYRRRRAALMTRAIRRGQAGDSSFG
ncbi:c-type cytochrome [Thermoflexus sp.]|uniref:c-type cytochrome n=1 Tax=Thermoflexus sp. TaxID=1969742 RepID=UPI0017648610|nr:c-type cytochrome [Thermoflexus sp.]